MSSKVQITNMALAHLAESADVETLDPPEESQEARYADLFFDTAKRRTLEASPWSFCTVQLKLELNTTEPDFKWQYTYKRPSLTLKVWGLYMDGDYKAATNYGEQNLLSQDFECGSLSDGTQIIYANIEDAYAIVTKDIEDLTVLSPTAELAMSYALAALLSGPIIKGNEGIRVAKGMWEMFYASISIASATDGNQSQETEVYTPEHIRAR